MSAEEHFPRLANFLADWFGEGWREEGYATPAEATRAFTGRTSRLMRRGLVAEVHQLLSRRFPSARMRHLLCSELGSTYDPTAEGKTFEAWLTETAGILAAGITGKEAESVAATSEPGGEERTAQDS